MPSFCYFVRYPTIASQITCERFCLYDGSESFFASEGLERKPHSTSTAGFWMCCIMYTLLPESLTARLFSGCRVAFTLDCMASARGRDS